VLDEKAECIREELFQQYREYCNKNGLKAMSQANFNKDIEGLGADLNGSVAAKHGRESAWRKVLNGLNRFSLFLAYRTRNIYVVKNYTYIKDTAGYPFKPV